MDKNQNDKTEGFEEFLHEPATTDIVLEKKKNRVALVLLILLVILGGFGIAAYLTTGRTWSVAATIVDDTVGNMSDYSVVVFSGVGEVLETDEESALLIREPVDELKDSASGENTEDVVDGEDNSSDLSHGLIPLEGDATISYANLGDRIMSVFYRAMSKLRSEESDIVHVSDVRDLYEIAGADVCTINISDLDYYSEPQTFKLGEKNLGVFSVSEYASRAYITSVINNFSRDDTNIVICIAQDTSMVATFDGIDVLITTCEETSSDNQDKGETYHIVSPSLREVGIILFSASDVPIFKSISEI